MKTSRHTPRRTARSLTVLSTALLIALLAAPMANADYRRHGHHPHSYDSFGWGLSLGYPSPYQGYRPGYRYYPGYGPPYYRGYYPRYGYGPSYAPGLVGSIGLGYSSWGRHDSWGLALSLPLFIGPRYAPPAVYAPPGQVLVPAAQSAPRQPPGDCLQVREYQSEIVIEGRVVPAYGSACLQANGSWKVISGPFAADY